MAITKGKLSGIAVIGIGWSLVIAVCMPPGPTPEELENNKAHQAEMLQERQKVREGVYGSYKDYMQSTYGITLSDQEAAALDCPTQQKYARFTSQKPCFSTKLMPKRQLDQIMVGYDYNQDSIPTMHDYGTYESDGTTYVLKSMSNSSDFIIEKKQ